jgi:hypothetical protein
LWSKEAKQEKEALIAAQMKFSSFVEPIDDEGSDPTPVVQSVRNHNKAG